MAGSGYALSIQLNPSSEFGFEVDVKSTTLLIHYDFGTNPNLQKDMKMMQKCLDNDIPIGLIFKKAKGKNKLLGLGKISNRTGTNFDIISYGISDEESLRLKEETTKEYESVTKDILLDRIETIDWKQYISKIDFKEEQFQKPNLSSDAIHRNLFTIRDIKNFTATGEWVIPIFQRFFDWKKDDVKDLWNSIFRGYYIGALLLWESKGDPDITTEFIKGSGIDHDHASRNFVILDGQQRITSIYYAISSPDFKLKGDTSNKRYFYIDFQEFFDNVDSDDIIKSSDSKILDRVSYEKLLFPIYKLGNYTEWIRYLKEYLHDQASERQEFLKISDLTDTISSRLEYIYDQFKISSVILPKSSTSSDEVSEIFEKLNTKGKPLSTFDLVIARMHKYKIQMRDLWLETLKENKTISKYFEKRSGVEKINLYIFESLSLVFSESKSCKRKDILNYFEKNSETREGFTEKWKEMSNYTEKALKLLEDTRNGFGVIEGNELPFEPMIPVLAALLHEIETTFKDTQPKCFKKLKNWYWMSVFSVNYSQGVEGKKSSDYKEMINWFNDDKSIPKDLEKFRKDYLHLVDLRSANKKASAVHKGLLCILSLNGATDFDKPIVLDGTKLHQDHIFPKSIFKYENDVDSILNKTWLHKNTNIKKSAKLPREYMLETLQKKYDDNESGFLEILKSHLIDEDAFEHIKNNYFEEFISKREELMLKAIGEAIGSDHMEQKNTLISPTKPYAAKMIARQKINNCKKYVKWFDKYFTFPGLDLLYEGLNREDVDEVKILLSIDKVSEDLKKKFKEFRKDFKLDADFSIDVQMRVMVDKKTIHSIHDRWIISKNVCYNMPSTDTIMRGQFSDIGETKQIPPFEDWWKNSLDIVDDWNKIKDLRSSDL